MTSAAQFPITALDQSFYDHILNTCSTVIKTERAILKIFNIIRLVLLPVALISLVIAQVITPFALICSLIVVVILGITTCLHRSHQIALKLARNTFKGYVDKFLALNNHQQMDEKIPILKKYPHFYKNLDLSLFEPAVSWEKAIKYCKKLYPEIAKYIDEQFSAVIPSPSLMSLNDIGKLYVERNKVYNCSEFQEYLTGNEQEIRTLINRAKSSDRIKLTFSDIERIVKALKPRSTGHPDSSSQSFQRLKLLSEKIEAFSN